MSVVVGTVPSARFRRYIIASALPSMYCRRCKAVRYIAIGMACTAAYVFSPVQRSVRCHRMLPRVVDRGRVGEFVAAGKEANAPTPFVGTNGEGRRGGDLRTGGDWRALARGRGGGGPPIYLPGPRSR